MRPIPIVSVDKLYGQLARLSTPSLNMSAISRFEETQQSVYGPFAVDEETASRWVPPEKSGGHRGRYSWTDSFGVINYLTLNNERNDPKYLAHAIRLSETVREVLRRTRDGKDRLPGASGEHPMGGGLRISKLEEEGGPDGDGQ